MKKLQKQLRKQAAIEQERFVHGKGQHKTKLLRVCELVDGWITRFTQYMKDIHIYGKRNSYSKTDHDATFMHMKEYHILNGQLKPGYNVNAATCNEFIIGSYLSADRSDVQTLIPFMTRLRETYSGTQIGSVVPDSGYESEENCCWFETPGNRAAYKAQQSRNT